jgi:hypothetical protein
MTGHPDPAVVLALREGVLEEPRASGIRAHVATCVMCQSLAADLESVLDADAESASTRRIDALVGAGRPMRARPAWLWLFRAGGLAAAAGLAWIVFAASPEAPALPDVLTAEATPAAGPSVLFVDRPILPEGDIDLTVRGDTTSRVSLEELVTGALDRVDAGDLNAGLRELERAVAGNPRSALAAVALAAVQLRDNRDADGWATLERARTLDPPVEVAAEIEWFRAVALARRGDRARARDLLDALCRANGPRGPRACVAAAELARTPESR